MKKIIALTLALLMLASALAGCGNSASAPTEAAPAGAAEAAPAAKEYTVGICQLMVHESLDKAT